MALIGTAAPNHEENHCHYPEAQHAGDTQAACSMLSCAGRNTHFW
jgi:hypothetical protein